MRPCPENQAKPLDKAQKKEYKMPMQKHSSDYLIIGSGLAGLSAALKLAEKASVILLTKEKSTFSNTSWAQGGIAAVMGSEDSFESHIRDTLISGAGLCKTEVVSNVVRQAPDRIADLINWGVVFDQKDKSQNSAEEVDLTREGGHSHRRILHVEDHTGANIHQALLKKALEHPRIQILEEYFAIDLIMNKQVRSEDMSPNRCLGAYAFERKTGIVHSFVAQQTILSTGGAGKVYLYTSNWSGATGDGIAMAYRAGARVANLEFMQFHPTCLYHKDSRNFLISEALRGEGGELINQQGQAFMKKYHPLGSLAPRDIVARSIDAEMKKTGAACVYLDLSALSAEEIRHRFPSITARCLEFGIDITQQPIPVVPAAHYLCGGVLTDVAGKTDIPGLWALGETSCNGLHGANRLASNSLLECLAMSHNASAILLSEKTRFPIENYQPADWKYSTSSDSDEMIVIHHMWDEIRTLMWNYVGIVRSDKRLLRAQSRLKNILNEVKEYYSNFSMHPDILELRNIAIVADLTIECALRRKESRGIHYSLDYPPGPVESDHQNPAQDTILLRGLR
jgi:L-aspartate oxidase